MTTIDTLTLTQTAFAILKADLERRNVLSSMHKAALYQLLDTCASYCAGTEHGRKAFPIPAGMGKSASIIAFITALHRLGYRIPVSIAASKVESLCDTYKGLIAKGVPVGDIGIKHSVLTASVPSTGDADRLYQLVTHSRVRSGRDFELFGQHQGVDRALCLYDEALIVSDSWSFAVRRLKLAESLLGGMAKTSKDHHLASLFQFVSDCTDLIETQLEFMDEAGDAENRGRPLWLPERDQETIDAWQSLIQRCSRDLGQYRHTLEEFLSVAMSQLQVLKTAQGDGIISIRQAVSKHLRNVVVLDASGPISDLVNLDTSIKHMKDFELDSLKSFEQVEVHQIMASGSRSAVEQTLKQAGVENAKVIKEVLAIIRREALEDPARCFLLVNFIPRDGLDVAKRLREALTAEGFDLEERAPAGQGDTAPRKRFEWLTWGDHLGLNMKEHCQSVILVGCLHRSHIDLSAAARGQMGNMAASTPYDMVNRIMESEIAGAVMQAASRGSCRNLNNGLANPMRLHLIHRSATLKTILDKVMPRAQWFFPDPLYLEKSSSSNIADEMLGRILGQLRTLDAAITKVSSIKLKAAMQIGPGRSDGHAFSRAVGKLNLALHGWALDGRSLVRSTAELYGFKPT
ncbi:hypothetical protein [Pseudorhodoferax sp. Leaf267]|uniref:hypothetical protein n=1 Tax=Pseudorhodoferax sp. Leaf267 TaxID=1736316 RepID=UPI0006F5FEEA|nr:hypothetical protein [Pseudorhodoferax sp. Leaf267]KQP22895.1 hypothetical protein ASF43_03110 [Pseudorhodoferax sp. Leaf267]